MQLSVIRMDIFVKTYLATWVALVSQVYSNCSPSKEGLYLPSKRTILILRRACGPLHRQGDHKTTSLKNLVSFDSQFLYAMGNLSEI